MSREQHNTTQLDSNKERKKERKKERREYLRSYFKTWYSKNRDRHCAYMRKYMHGYFQSIKLEVFKHYSPTLTCQYPGCGFGDMRALSIDHINGGGARHIRQIQRNGSSFYQWLKKHDFPPGFQVLCMNHQWIKRAENEEVRH
jgi:tRNA-dihydrouridine synthase